MKSVSHMLARLSNAPRRYIARVTRGKCQHPRVRISYRLQTRTVCAHVPRSVHAQTALPKNYVKDKNLRQRDWKDRILEGVRLATSC